MDKIYFRRWVLPARIGVLPHEKEAAQSLAIDLEFDVDARSAAAQDVLANTIDYRQIKAAIEHVIQLQHYELIETVAERIAERLLADFPIRSLRLCVEKPDIFADMDAVGICIER